MVSLLLVEDLLYFKEQCKIPMRDFLLENVMHYKIGLQAQNHTAVVSALAGLTEKNVYAFSVACVVEPDILIVDEILSVGDADFQEKSRARMMELMTGGTTVFFVSHSLEQIRQMCSRVVWLEHGRIQAQGDTEKICSMYEGGS